MIKAKDKLKKKLKLESNASDKTLIVECEKLKQTYELVYATTQDADIKNISKRKIDDLTRMMGEAGLSTINISSSIIGYENVITSAYKMLQSGKKNNKEIDIVINKLKGFDAESTAENFYLQTLLMLQKDCGLSEFESAKQTIEKAISIEPTNEVFLEIKQGIELCVEKYLIQSEKERMIVEQQNQEQRERQRRLAAETARRRRRNSCCECCEGIGGIIGMFLDICCCSCCDC